MSHNGPMTRFEEPDGTCNWRVRLEHFLRISRNRIIDRAPREINVLADEQQAPSASIVSRSGLAGFPLSGRML